MRLPLSRYKSADLVSMPVDPPFQQPIRLGSTKRPHPVQETAEGGTVASIRSIRDLAGLAAFWRQPSQLRPEYELVHEDGVVATLRWRKPGGTTAVARTPDGTWSLKAVGFLSPRVTLRLPSSEIDFATFRARSNGEGIVEAPGNKRFFWRCISFWQNTWAFFDQEGTRLITFRPDAASLKIGALVSVDPKGAMYQDCGFLAPLGWYILVMMAEDTSAMQTSAV
jgi:hypothetical protein